MTESCLEFNLATVTHNSVLTSRIQVIYAFVISVIIINRSSRNNLKRSNIVFNTCSLVFILNCNVRTAIKGNADCLLFSKTYNTVVKVTVNVYAYSIFTIIVTCCAYCNFNKGVSVSVKLYVAVRAGVMVCRIVPAILAKFKVVTISVRTKRSLCCNLTTYNVVSYCVESEVINLIVISCEIKLTSRTVVMSCNTVSFTSGIYLRNPLTVVMSSCINVSVNVVFATVTSMCSISLIYTSRFCNCILVSVSCRGDFNVSCNVTSGASLIRFPTHFSTSGSLIFILNNVMSNCGLDNLTTARANDVLKTLCIHRFDRDVFGGIYLNQYAICKLEGSTVATVRHTAIL